MFFRRQLLIRMILVMFVASIGTSALSAVREIKISGDWFPASIRLGEKVLPMRGGTRCRHRAFSVYTAAFYADPAARSVSQIEGKTAKSLILHYHRDIDREDIIEASWQTLRKNPNINLGELSSRIDAMHELFRDVRDGDHLR